MRHKRGRKERSLAVSVPVPVHRHLLGGLTIDIRGPQVFMYRETSKVSLAQLLWALDPEVQFLLFASAGRTQISRERIVRRREDEQEFMQMPCDLRLILQDVGMRAYWVVGHWTETIDPVEEFTASLGSTSSGVSDVIQYSWLFLQPAGSCSSGDWLQVAVEMARLYRRDAFLLRTREMTALHTQSGRVVSAFSSDENAIEAWTRLVQRPTLRTTMQQANRFSTTPGCGSDAKGERSAPAFFFAEPHNNMSKWLFASLGIERIPNDKSRLRDALAAHP